MIARSATAGQTGDDAVMDDLVTWLTAQLDAEERATRDAVAPYLNAEGEHIARWDPARVLAEVEAKRAILAGHPPVECSNVRCPVGLHCGTCEYDDPSGNHWPCLTARALALPYRDRPGYRAEWAPEQ